MITLEHNGTTLELSNTHAYLEDKQDTILIEDLTDSQRVALSQCHNLIVSAMAQASCIIKG